MQLNAVQTLLGLLSHDNSDIALAVVDLVQELTDVETGSESEEKVEGLIAALLKEQVSLHRPQTVCPCTVPWGCGEHTHTQQLGP